jgi:hypothetical protein
MPLLDFFRRGEVAHDVKLLAATGALAPRAHEQLAILILLLDDPDPGIRGTALRTIDSIPEAALTSFLARSDVSIAILEFFGDRGVFPAAIPSIGQEEPLVESGADPDPAVEEAGDEGTRESMVQRLASMGFTEKLRAAVKGPREVRAILIRDPNKMVAASVLSSPKVSESEVESFARMANVSEDILRIIASNRAWTRNYGVLVGLARNPKTPIGTSLNLLSRLNDRDVAAVSMDRNVPEALRQAARRKVVFGGSR